MIERLRPFEMAVVGEGSRGEDALLFAEETPAAVYILDISLPGIDGIETSGRLMQEYPNAKTVLFTMYQDKMTVQRAFFSGINGYVLKQSPPEELIEAIETVYRGDSFMSDKIFHYAIPENSGSSQYSPLTDRERVVFKLVCDGLTERMVADELRISVNTVHVHKSNIMKKLDIHSKTGLIKYGIRERLIPPVV